MPRRRKGSSFAPSREFIREAVEDFLNSGGKITFLPFKKQNFKSLLSIPDNKSEVDEFLLDG